MNIDTFTRLLHDVDDADWQAITDGKSLLLVDDTQLLIGEKQAANAIIQSSNTANTDPLSLKQSSIKQAAEILTNYYLTHPLTQKGFNLQVRQLLQQHGADQFTAPGGQLPKRTLFVDGGVVVAENSDSPRHRYGTYCEISRLLSNTELMDYVEKWITQGEAYQSYLSMNVCRYNC